MENLNGLVQTYTHNVKRWRGGEMIQRWVCAALLEAAKNFRWVRGHRHMHILLLLLIHSQKSSLRRPRSRRIDHHRSQPPIKVQQRMGHPRSEI